MKHFTSNIIFLLFLLIASCEGSNDSNYSNNKSTTNDNSYHDGTYCADVTYYNSNTGTSRTYTLNVEVKDNQLILIHWPNGGWLDGSHFSPKELDSDGFCSFTSDRGYQYRVQIRSTPCISSDSYEKDDEVDKCIRCGNEVYNYRMYCKKCIDEDENTCGYCGQFEYYVYGGKCTTCKRKEEEEEKSRDEDNDK
jgi:hypothetical protein